MIKTFEQFISDKKEEERIDEGFLDTVKKAISAVSKAPEKYVEHANNNLKKMKHDAKYLYKDVDPEKYAEELDNLNNDDDLGKIFKFAKKFYTWNTDYGKFITGETYSNKSFIDDMFEKIKKDFDCEDNIERTYAVYDLTNLFCAKYIKDANEKDDNKSSSSKNSAAQCSAIAAAVMMARK